MKPICHKPFFETYIHYTGEVSVCCRIGRSLGNLHDVPIEELWNGQVAKEIRSLVLSHRYLDAGCPPSCPEIVGRMPPVGTEPAVYDDPVVNTCVQYCIANVCNLNCIMCGKPHLIDPRRVDEISWNNFRECLPTVKSLILTGGEFFSLPNATWILEYIRDHFTGGLNIITNLHLITERDVDLLTKIPSRLEISVDSWDPETYAYIRQPQTLDHFLKKLRMVEEVKSRSGGWSPHLVNNMVVMMANHGQILDSFRIVKARGFKMFRAIAMRNMVPEGQPSPIFDKENFLSRDRIRAVDVVMNQMEAILQEERGDMELELSCLAGEILYFLDKAKMVVPDSRVQVLRAAMDAR